jgi:hypothetical protein
LVSDGRLSERHESPDQIEQNSSDMSLFLNRSGTGRIQLVETIALTPAPTEPVWQ